MKAHDLISLRTGGGGGFGDPLEREPEKVLNDVVDGYITIEQAKDDYGVAIGEDTMKIDAEATKRLRGPRER